MAMTTPRIAASCRASRVNMISPKKKGPPLLRGQVGTDACYRLKAKIRRRRANAHSIPMPAIKPGRPAPATGPGTAANGVATRCPDAAVPTFFMSGDVSLNKPVMKVPSGRFDPNVKSLVNVVEP